ncbi:PTS sugar transporter subunit IIB [Egicoccus sp. AB-alg2]|uniref:PTS sugar transporter subunit IIB n=1 Tax=Egicoccus sp. AB-alg2 TaxID=3242693 RepID=UPI00359D21E7
MRIATVCGMGFGTSMMLKLTVDKILREAGVAAEVSPVDLGSVKTMQADLIVAPSDMRSHLGGSSTPVVYIDNLVNKAEIAEKVVPAAKEVAGEA